jgi:Zn-dependent protease
VNLKKPFLVFEDIKIWKEFFRVFGVTISKTDFASLSPFFWSAIGMVMAFLGRDDDDILGICLKGIGYGLILLLSNTVHSIGHVLAGRIVNSRVQVVVITSTRDVIRYAEPGEAASDRNRLWRSLGGPMANLVIGILAISGGYFISSTWLTMTGFINLCVAVWTLLPIPTLDGEVVWNVLLRSRSRNRFF